MNIKKIVAGVLACCVLGGTFSSVPMPADNAVVTAFAVDECTYGTYDKLLYYKNYGDHIEIYGSYEKSVTSVVIPDKIDGLPVTSIGVNTFAYCSELTEITIPYSVTSIGSGAFKGTPWLETKQAENPIVIVNGILIDGTTCSGEVVIPDSVTSIGGAAFYGCSGLTEITIPDGVTSIGHSAFYGCSGLTEITIPDSITSIEYSVFSGCTGLTEINIPDSVTSIGDSALIGCSSLTSINIPDSVEIIGGGAFAGCNGLTEITIPNGVKRIAGVAFSNCRGLTKITILNPNCEIYDGDNTISNGYNGLDKGSYFSGTICGYLNSTAQAYAKKYNRKFIALSNGNTTTTTIATTTTSTTTTTTTSTSDNTTTKPSTSTTTSTTTAATTTTTTTAPPVTTTTPQQPVTFTKGDIDNDGAVTADDASIVLAEYARMQSGKPAKFTETQLKAADFNGDGVVNADDASLILAYYAAMSTGKDTK